MPSEAQAQIDDATDDDKHEFRRASERQRQKRANRRADRDARQMNLADAAATKRLDEWGADDE